MKSSRILKCLFWLVVIFVAIGVGCICVPEMREAPNGRHHRPEAPTLTNTTVRSAP